MKPTDRIREIYARMAEAQAQIERLNNAPCEGAAENGDCPIYSAAEHQADRVAFEDAIAGQSLGEVSPDVVAAVKRRLDEHEPRMRAAQEFATHAASVRAGILRRRAAAQAAYAAATKELEQATMAWVKQELDIADRAYVEAAEQYAEAYTRVEARRFWLHQHGGPVIGRPPWTGWDDRGLDIPALSTYSASVALARWPHSKNYNGYYDARVTPRTSASKVNEAFEIELEGVLSSLRPAGNGS